MDGIWLVVLLVLGFSMLFKPEVLWKIENIFSVKNRFRFSNVFLTNLILIRAVASDFGSLLYIPEYVIVEYDRNNWYIRGDGTVIII